MSAVPGLFGMLQALVAEPSVSCSTPAYDMGNRSVIDLLGGWLEALGFTVDITPIEGQPSKANLVATLGQGSGGLVLAGHTDTVPWDERRWQFEPFKLTERDNRWYGLGTADMKGFFPIAIEAARPFLEERLREPLIIVATADEESSMDGARQLVDQGRLHGRCALIGEPTELRPARLHKGMMMEAVTIVGRSGHSSDPALGASALEAMHEAMTELLGWRAELQARYRRADFEVAVPTLNLGCIHGGDNPNRICGECELHFDLRPLPGMDILALRAEAEGRLRPIAERRGVNIALRSLFPGVQPFEQPLPSELIEAVESFTGHRAGAVNFATEAPFMRELGMETVVCGPGSIRQAHQPDEFLALDQLRPAIDLLQNLIKRFCL